MRSFAFLMTALLGFAGPAMAGGLRAPDPEFGPETLSLVAATEALFAALEAENAAPDRSPGHRIELRPARPEADPVSLPGVGANALRADLGPVSQLTAYGITWYPTGTLAGTVDFVGTWDAGKNLVCGYVTWDMSDPAAPVLAAMTTAYLDTGTLLRLPPDAAHAELLRANCAFGEIEPNFALVRPAG